MELAALRESMRKLAPSAILAPARRAAGISTGFEDLDRHLRAGGVPQGQLTEISGAASSGKTALALGILAAATRAGALVAIIDAQGGFYPPAAAALGVDLTRLLVARVPAPKDEGKGAEAAKRAVRAAEILARSRAFSPIVVALGAGARFDAAQARRLRAAAQRSGAALIVLSERRGAADGAALRVEVAPAPGRRGRHLLAEVSKGAAQGGTARAAISFAALRIDDTPPTELPPTTRRLEPGIEHHVRGRP